MDKKVDKKKTPKLGRCVLLNKMTDGKVRQILITEEQSNLILSLLDEIARPIKVLGNVEPVEFTNG